jgi:hypothetical protein
VDDLDDLAERRAAAPRPDNGAAGGNSTLGSLTPEKRRHVRAVASTTYEQLAAAFGFEPTAVLTALTPKERRCVESPAALTLSNYAAAFGTAEPCVTAGAGRAVLEATQALLDM